MAEAVTMVKRDLGAHAVILNARKYRKGGVFGLGGREVFEITAADGKYAGNSAQVARTKGVYVGSPGGSARRPSGTLHDSSPSQPQPRQTAGELIRRTYLAAKAEMQQAQVAAPTAPGPQMTAAVAATPHAHTDQLTDEVQAVRRLVERLMQQQKKLAPQPDLPDKLFDQYLTLLKNQVTEELAEEIVDQVKTQLTAEQLEDARAVRLAVSRQIAKLVPTDHADGKLAGTDDGRPRIIALIGPTGVGKTTTIAKLAATFKLKQDKNVGLITLDTYRIAAVDQLRTYASIIGLPLHVAMTVEELRSALVKTRGCDVVLIDTAGHGPRDDPRLQQLQQFIEAANPHEVHLVLSCTCSQNVLMQAAERFGKIRADRIIFTKLDEAVSFGVLLNVVRKVNKRLSYVTTGQEVPHQIEPGRPERVAELVLGGDS